MSTAAAWPDPSSVHTPRLARGVAGPEAAGGVHRYGTGSQRERRPGVWEVRVPTTADPVTGRARQVSVTVHGTAADADARRALLLARRENAPTLPPPHRITLAELLTAWLAADHPWKPSTLVGYRSVARALGADPLAERPAQSLTPEQVREVVGRWQHAGAGPAVVGGPFRALRPA